MLVAGLVLSVFGLGFFCWVLFTLAIYALPFLAGLTAGLAAFHGNAGLLGAVLVGLLAGSSLLILGQVVFATARTLWVRVLIGLIYAVPAAVAGYQLSFGLTGIGMPAGAWQQVFAAAGAIVVGMTAFARMTLFVPPSTGQGPVDGSAGQPSACGRMTCEDDGSRQPSSSNRLAKMGALKLGSSS